MNNNDKFTVTLPLDVLARLATDGWEVRVPQPSLAAPPRVSREYLAALQIELQRPACG